MHRPPEIFEKSFGHPDVHLGNWGKGLGPYSRPRGSAPRSPLFFPDSHFLLAIFTEVKYNNP